MSSSWTHERARIASLSRSRSADDPELADARQKLKATRLEAYVRKSISEAPALTEDQRNRIAALLRTGGDVR